MRTRFVYLLSFVALATVMCSFNQTTIKADPLVDTQICMSEAEAREQYKLGALYGPDFESAHALVSDLCALLQERNKILADGRLSEESMEDYYDLQLELLEKYPDDEYRFIPVLLYEEPDSKDTIRFFRLLYDSMSVIRFTIELQECGEDCSTGYRRYDAYEASVQIVGDTATLSVTHSDFFEIRHCRTGFELGTSDFWDCPVIYLGWQPYKPEYPYTIIAYGSTGLLRSPSRDPYSKKDD